MLMDCELSVICSSSSELQASMNWLNRLRAAKGFPVDPELSIDDFLTSQGLSSEETRSIILSSQNENGALTDACNRADNRFSRFTESYSSQTIIIDIPNQAPCSQSGFDNKKISDSDIAHSKVASDPSTLLSIKNFQPVLDTGNMESNSNPCSAVQQLKDIGTENCIQQSLCKDTTQLYFDMLSELFCMETCSSNLETTKKRPRKQEKPKNCNTSSDVEPSSTVITSMEVHTSESNKNTCREIMLKNPPAWHSEAAPLEKKSNNSFSTQVVTKGNPPCHQRATKKNNIDSSKRKDNALNDTSTGNHIFVIDTSLPGWSVEKLVIRKGNSWRVQSKESSISMEESSKKPMKVTLKRSRTVQDRDPLELKHANKMQLQCDSWDISKEQCQKDTLESRTLERTWNTMPQTQMRSQRKPRKNVLVEDESAQDYQNLFNGDSREQPNTLAPDHPANQPKEGLVYSIYKVFMQAGRSGLTAREAVSRILDQGLPGLHEGGVAPRVEVLKIVSNSPYFMPLEESKYILCSALVGDEDHPNGTKQDLFQLSITKIDEDQTKVGLPESSKAAKQQSDSQYWAACAASAIQRARTGKTHRKHTLSPSFVNSSGNHETQEGKGSLQKKRLKSMKQDTTGLGNQCNRSDGKGWHCPLRAKIGYLLCDHHLDRLRTRVKTHIKSKMLSKEERKRILGGSWMVKKVVERSRIGRHIPVGLNQHRKLTSEGMFDHEVNV